MLFRCLNRFSHFFFSLLFLLGFFLFPHSSFLQGEETLILPLQGHLGNEEIIKAKKTLEEILSQHPSQLLLHINSTSGDAVPVLELAKQIFNDQHVHSFKILAYIEENALGPAAILPFLANEIYISRIVTWGDISLDSDRQIPPHVLRSQVESLIPAHSPQLAVLKMLAAGMSDPHVIIIDDKGWKIAKEQTVSFHESISGQGETLVVNQNQLNELKVSAGIWTLAQFQENFSSSLSSSQPLPDTSKEKITLLDDSLKSHIFFSQTEPNAIGLITLDDRQSGISQSTWIYVKKALEYYKESKPRFIILELNTPGGEVLAAQKISDALKEMDTQYEIPIVTVINNGAISAGAMLAYSTRYISVVKDGAMGAAAPVISGQAGEMKEASEKINSALRTDFANRAQFFHRNPWLAEAMVDKDLIVVQRRGKIIKLDHENQLRTQGTDPDFIISAKGKLLTLGAEQLIKYGVADLLLLPQQLEKMTSKEKIEGKWPAHKTLLFQQPFLKHIPNAMIDEYQMDWRTQFYVFLTHPAVSSLLFLAMMLGFYIEFNTPGFGLPGTVGLTALMLIILSSFALEIGNMLELLLLLIGVVFVSVEILVFPTSGLLGGVGILFFLMGLFGMMIPEIRSLTYDYGTPAGNVAEGMILTRLSWLISTFFLGIFIMGLLGRYVMPRLNAYHRLVLSGNEQVGYSAVNVAKDFPPKGAQGIVVAPLRPAGKVIINETLYDAISPGGFIDEGMTIYVLRTDGGSLIVNKDEVKK